MFVFPFSKRQFDLQKGSVRTLQIAFWLCTLIGLTLASILIYFCYECAETYNYSASSYILLLWFATVVVNGFALLLFMILYYAAKKPVKNN